MSATTVPVPKPTRSGRKRGRLIERTAGVVMLCAAAGLLVALVASPVVVLAGLAAKTTADDFNQLPSFLKIPAPLQDSVILDATGHRLAILRGSEDRALVTFAQIPVVMRESIVDIEDNRFYTHHGIDFRGTLRALLKNQQVGSASQGGSTLTQQYVKNVLLESANTPEGQKAATEKSFKRKLREARYALALEHRLSKNEILTRYLNIAYFGDGAYGVGTAANHYFNTPVNRLTLPQAALLAGLVQNPTAYNPRLHPLAARTRRDIVLDRMAQLHTITTAQAQAAERTPVVLAPRRTQPDPCTDSYAPYFCQYVRATLSQDPRLGATVAERERKVDEGGLVIQTSLDPRIQAAAQNATDSIMSRTTQYGAPVVVLQPGTGKVLAMAENRTYGTPTGAGDFQHTEINYTTNNTAFQPGSTFKMFTLTTALEQGVPPSFTLNAPNCYHSPVLDNPSGPKACQTPTGPGYSNAGDGEGGIYPLDKATWDSVNTYYIQLEEKVGVTKVAAMARLLGVTAPGLAAGKVSPTLGSLTLGSREVSPLDQATAYATLAAHGKRCYPAPVTSIVTRDSKQAVPFTPALAPCKQVITPQVADTAAGILEGVITQGTGQPNGQIGRPAAGKTGTAQGFVDAWFVGFVPQLSVAVAVGDPRSISSFPLLNVSVPGGSYGQVYGGDLPTKIWAATMRASLQGQPVLPMPNPSNAVPTPVTPTGQVPYVVGESLTQAENTIGAAGFSWTIGASQQSSVPAGDVAATYPGSGFTPGPGSSVTISPSSGYGQFQPQSYYTPPVRTTATLTPVPPPVTRAAATTAPAATPSAGPPSARPKPKPPAHPTPSPTHKPRH